eukprot:13779086-Alexandrium_andersonii.AAC.1
MTLLRTSQQAATSGPGGTKPCQLVQGSSQLRAPRPTNRRAMWWEGRGRQTPPSSCATKPAPLQAT